MSRLSPIDLERTARSAKTLLEAIEDEMGMVPGLLRVMAHSPAALDGYLAIQGRLDSGKLDRRLRYQIAVAVSQAQNSRYCVAAYTALGRAAGLSEQALSDARVAASPNRRLDTALKFSRSLRQCTEQSAQRHLTRLQKAGFSDGEIVEIVAHVMVVSIVNSIYHLSDIALDFPPVDWDEAEP